jgi:osmotically-inducible protein OsmY
MTGEAPTAELRSQTENIVKEIPMVRQINNEMVIGEPSPFKARANDSLITAKVKVDLLRITDIEGFNGARVKVVTDNGTVYLMGLVTRKEADAVAEVARQVGGVEKVVKLFEYID